MDSFSYLIIDGEVDRKPQHGENQTNCHRQRQTAPLDWGASRSIEGAVIDDFEQCLVEVTIIVRVRIEEETLGAAFHLSDRVVGLAP